MLFHYALVPGGILFLGASESIGEFTSLFEPLVKKLKIFKRSEGSAVRGALADFSSRPAGYDPALAAAPGYPVKAKEAIGDRICLIGNIPSSLMISAEPRKVEEYCQHLIEKAGKGGGFIMATGTALDEAKPENLRAMIEYTKKNGKYR